jgi:hypothetical protein
VCLERGPIVFLQELKKESPRTSRPDVTEI